MKSASPVERFREAPVAAPRELAQLLLMQAEQLRRLAGATADTVIHGELTDLAGRCDAAAATILSHWNGHADKLTSRVSQT